ncbi:hypothetical protein C1701_00510 [Actinoalloteichus sp. AHMU CJ021]|nr:hypothetical protein C1701_00510 [Actinoalloteichus sp. AHMU CJ021]
MNVVVVSGGHVDTRPLRRALRATARVLFEWPGAPALDLPPGRGARFPPTRAALDTRRRVGL